MGGDATPAGGIGPWQRAVRLLRQIVGAPDYSRYLERHNRIHPEKEPLSEKAYYESWLKWRYSPERPPRC